jgi:MFS family permease
VAADRPARSSVPPAPSTGHPRTLVGTLVFLATVTTAVGSLGAPLLATIAHEDHVSIDASQWALTVTLIVGAVTSPILGQLGDGARRKPVIIASLMVVLLGCVVSALPVGFGWLLVGRALQGLGLGLVPLAIAVARDALPPDRARSAIMLLGVFSAAGIGAGYPLFALVVEHFGLPAAFWLGAAVCLLVIVAAVPALPDGPPRPRRSLDPIGAGLLGLGVTGLLLAVAEGGQWGWLSGSTLGVAAFSIVLLAAWTWWELRYSAPLVDLRLLRLRPVLAANVIVLLVGLGSYPLLSLVVRFVETPVGSGYGFGDSVVVGATMLVPFSLASYLASRVIGPLRRIAGLEQIVALGCLVLIASMAVFWFARDTHWQLIVAMTLSGLGVGAVFAVNPVQIVGGVPPEQTASANSFYQVVRVAAFSAGSALSATLLVLRTPVGAAHPDASGYSLTAAVSVAILVLALGFALWFARPTSPPRVAEISASGPRSVGHSPENRPLAGNSGS